MLEAKDLPTSRLSEFITERLNRELEKEHHKRAEQQVGRAAGSRAE